MHQTYTYLALGDSYTIGESVDLYENFPYQTVQLLRKQGYNFTAPEIIARTGWSTDELDKCIRNYRLLPRYDFVSLLIGVNNQFRGRAAEEYKEEMEGLIKFAMNMTNDKNRHVIVLSIPDYSTTPFALTLDPVKVAKDIEIFNNVNRALSIQYKIQYLPATLNLKKEHDLDFLADDQLHPSAKEYENWAEKLSSLIIAELK